MGDTTISLTTEEQRRGRVLTHLVAGDVTIDEAAELLGVSVRHAWRLKSAFLAEGPAVLAHGNRGRPSPRRIDAATRARIVTLAKGDRYRGANDSHLTDLLAEREGIELSRPSVRRILRAAGVRSPRTRRAPRHRSRRERMPREGMLVQVDGSRHDWLEGRGPWLTLVGAIDDATGKLLFATFRDEEDTAGYLQLVRDMARHHGLPEAIYRDRHSSLEHPSVRRPPPELSVADGVRPTHVGRALAELGIGSIAASSPQAKGRAERGWGTAQGRLPIELRLAGAVDRATAEPVLAAWLARFNARFAVPAADPEPAWRPVPEGLDLDAICAFRYERVIANDATVRVGGLVLDVPRQPGGRSLAGRRVEVRLELDGRIVVADGPRVLVAVQGPSDPGRLRDLEAGRSRLPWVAIPPPRETPGYPPPKSHPWRRATPGSRLEAIRRSERGLTGSLTS
jgi:transposase